MLIPYFVSASAHTLLYLWDYLLRNGILPMSGLGLATLGNNAYGLSPANFGFNFAILGLINQKPLATVCASRRQTIAVGVVRNLD